MDAQPLKSYFDLDLTPELDGSLGTNRAPIENLQVAVHNDIEAMGRFLEEYKSSPGTYRIYQREADRVGMWAIYVKKKALSSLTVVDVEQYIEFLADPQPAHLWCGPKAPKHSDRWRPFVGPNEANARLTALSAINSMLNYWVQLGYLAGNPLGLFRQLKKKILAGFGKPESKGKKVAKTASIASRIDDSEKKVERILDSIAMEAIWRAIEAMGVDADNEAMQADYERARFIMNCLYFLAPRAGELETHSMNSFRESQGRWWWHVVGKGDKAAKVPLTDDMLNALVRYRKHLNLSPVPDIRDDSPILRSTRHPGQGITARRLNQLLKDIFNSAIQYLPKDAYAQEMRLKQASAHWGRHTAISVMAESKKDPLMIQKDARHADPRTTQLYIHVADEARHDEAQKVKLKAIQTIRSNINHSDGNE